MDVIPFVITDNRIRPETPLPSGDDVLGIIGGGDAYFIYYKGDEEGYQDSLAGIEVVAKLNREDPDQMRPEHPEEYAEQ